MSSQNDAHSELDDPGVDLGKALAALHHWTMPKLTSPSERELALKRLPSGCLYLPRTWRRRCKLAPSLSLSPLHECDIHRSCLYRRHCHSFFFTLSIVPRDSYSLSHSFPTSTQDSFLVTTCCGAGFHHPSFLTQKAQARTRNPSTSNTEFIMDW